MDKIHKDVLAKMTYKIMGRISNPRIFSEYLREIFSMSDMEEIGAKENQKGPTSGTQTMLSILEKRGPEAYGLFILVLRSPDIKLSDLADELEEEERKLRGKTEPPYSVPTVQNFIPGNGNGRFNYCSPVEESRNISKQASIPETNKLDNQELVLTEETLIKDIPYRLRKRIEMLLDPPDPNQRDWRGMASVMDLNSQEVRQLENDRENGKMKGLVERMIQTHKSVNDLLVWLKHPEVQRFDVVDEIKKEHHNIPNSLLQIEDDESSEDQESEFSEEMFTVTEENPGNNKDLEDLHVLHEVPPEIIARGALAVAAYNNALREGKTCIKRVPVMLIGQDRSGKTSLKKSLKGLLFNPDEESTVGIDLDPAHFKVSNDVWKLGGNDQESDSDEAISYEYRTAQLIVDSLKEEEQTRKEKPLSEPVMSVGTSLSSSRTSEEPEEGGRREPGPSIGHETDTYILKDVPEKIATLVEKLLQRVNKDDGEDMYSVLWDFGGQFVYYVTHPLFLTPKAIYLLIYDLSQNPHDRATPLVKQGMFKKVEDSYCLKTNLDYLDFWMSHVASLTSQDEVSKRHTDCESLLPEKVPPVFLVCTHADTPSGGGDPRALAREIFYLLQSKPYSSQLVERVFVVDNTKSGSKPECPDVACLRKKVLAVAKELPQMKEAIPIKWLRYEKMLQIMKEDGFKHISLEVAKQIASEGCEIVEDEEILTLLNFLHDQRILIHFDDTPELNNLVVLDTQWLIDVFKKVITVKPFDYQERKFKELWRQLEKTGILEEELLEHVWGPLFDCEETCAGLIAIMEKFSLLCPLPTVHASCRQQYLVPSMLMSHPPEEIIELIASAVIPSLFLRFESGLVPAGLFPRLVVKFFQWCSNAKEFPCQIAPQFFHNFARFFIFPGEGYSVVLLCHSSSIEVVIVSVNGNLARAGRLSSNVDMCLGFGNDNTDSSLAHFVRSQLAMMIDSMRNEFFWLKNMRCEMSFLCPVCCHQGTVNYCQNHRSKFCKQEECLHFFSESELHKSAEIIVCTRSASALDYRIQVKQFAPWFAFTQEKQQEASTEFRGRRTCNLPSVDGEQHKSLALVNDILGSCDAQGGVVQLLESLQLDRSSLENPEPETKRLIRCLAREARSSNRLDVLKHLREIVPAGTTGPLLNDHLHVRDIPSRQRTDLAVHLCGGDEWKEVAERLGFNQAYIRCFDSRYRNPLEVVLTCCHTSVGELYDILVECGLPLPADLL